MADHLYSRIHAANDDEEIVITGMAGRFPNSNHVAEFRDNLYNKVDMVDDDERRWRHTNVEIPRRSGKVYNLDKFDATFFGVHFKQAHTMDPQCRLLVEHAYEAVLDAGINPKDLRGSRTGVFVGACFAESEKTWFYEKMTTGGFGITGCSRAMLANRISYTMGLTGPSFLLDTACSSSMYALDCAFSAIRSGECDAAIVGASNLLLHPYVTLQFARLGVLAPNGYCRPFDNDASGYTRSEAISCLFLQKAKDAKRIYSTVVYSKTNCDGYKEEGITYPSGRMQMKLLTEFYQDIGIEPNTLDYVEAHSTGTIVGDPEECNALDNIFCNGRTKPLPVGSVKSNIGHTESAAGVCSITKVLLAFESGQIAPNINLDNLRTGIPSLEQKRLEVVREITKLEGPLVGVNAFGFGGANAHCLLRQHSKVKVNNGAPTDRLPRLVNWSGRSELGVNTIFDDMITRPLDAEYVGLLHNCQNESISGMVFRGYGLFNHTEGQNANCLSRDVQHFTGLKRPIVWVFSGMGSQWTEMGTALLNIPIFKAAIDKCHAVLLPRGLDLINIITSSDKTTFDNILHSFVGIASIQIGIVDILNELGMEPDFIIGHSVGELGCAYADGCFTAEQMILSAYSRGKASLETEKIFGSMAAIGLGYRKIRNMLPPTIDVACHNGPDSCTISGPAKEVEIFVAKLTADGIFAKEVPCSNIAYHSRYISDMGPNLLKRLNEVIPESKTRSAKWLSSSVPKTKWEQAESNQCSAQYHTNNLLSAVLFEETSALLPTNALTIEIAPHGLLQAILRKSMPNAVHIGLTQRGNKDNVQYFFNALGKIYLNGVDIPIDRLYPPITFPVSRGTSMISPLIKWDHNEDWFVTKFEMQRVKSGERKVRLALSDQDYKYIAGHMIDGRVLVPATAYLHLVWETLGIMKGPQFFDLLVEFEDVKFLRATNIAKDVEIEFTIMIQPGTGRFEITEGSAAVVTGYIREVETADLTELPEVEESNAPILPQRDFYKELRLRGYHYNGAFRGVSEARGDGLKGKVKWEDNWVAFMDCLLQIHIVGKDTRALMLPTRIQKLVIDPKLHVQMASAMDPENAYFDVKINKHLNTLQAGGIEIRGLTANPVGRRKPPGIPVLETYKFISHLPLPELSKTDAIRVLVQLALENNPILKVKAIEILPEVGQPILEIFQEALGDLPLITSDLMVLTPQDIVAGNIHVEDGKLSTQQNCFFVVATGILSNPKFADDSAKSLHDSGYLVSREKTNLSLNNLTIPKGYQLLAVSPLADETLILLQRLKKKIVVIPTIVKVSSNDTKFLWLENLRKSMKNGPVIVYAEKDTLSGVVGLVNCIRKEPEGHLVSCVFIDDDKAPAFDVENPYYKSYLKLGLGINVWRNGQWGSYRHVQLIQDLKLAPTSQHCYANVLTRGDLSSLSWMRGPILNIKDEGVVKLKYASLNFRDVMMATGKIAVEVIGTNRLDQECVLGFEFAGTTQNGKKVFGMIMSGAMASHVRGDDGLLWDCPEHWSLQEAATVAVVYVTAYVALILEARIQEGKSILIHAGSGGVGLAAIRVAFAYGLDVFTTVSTEAKKKFLLKTFPQLKESHIGNSRDTSFEKMVMTETNGIGVDYCLNSLSQEKLFASIRSLATAGKFLEIGKFDMANDTKLGLGEFLREISFHAILVDNLFRASLEDKLAIKKLLDDGIKSGIVQPLHSEAYPAMDVEQAFRHLGSGKHVGKVLLQVRDKETDELSYPVKLLPRVYCHENLSYVIPGGLGGFGLELADWLILRGAKKIVFSSSKGLSKPYQAYRIQIWESYGVKIIINTSNILTKKGCEDLILEATKLGPVGGIFNLAVQLRDSILDNQTTGKFTECMAPKAYATKYLDEVSRKMCPQLKYFVIFSSVSCGRGNAGQSNYGMANSVMERIIEQRVKQGLPGKAIQWGAVGEVGLVADMLEDKLDMEIGGTLQQRISSCLTEMDALMFCDDPIVASMVVAEKRVGAGSDGNIIETVMNIMSLRDIKTISMEASLSELGMDSLMAVEIKQTLEREFELFLTPQDLRSLTFLKLQQYTDSREKDGLGDIKLKLANEHTPVGMNLLLRNLGDETHSGKTILRVKTQNESPKYPSSAIIIPGIEGVAGHAWQNIASSLTMPAFVLQITKTITMKTIPEIVAAISDEAITEAFKSAEYFYLVGYSFGALVTLELARRLEEHGMTGQVLLIDGSPIFLKKLATSQMKVEYTEESIQIILVADIIRMIFPEENPEDLYARIAVIPTWEERVDKLVELSKDQNIYSEEYVRQSTQSMYNRIKIVLELDPDQIKPIKSPITLVRPTDVSVVDIEEDYELGRFTNGQVNLKFLEGNHVTILENPKLPQIINEMDPALESDKSFKKYITN